MQANRHLLVDDDGSDDPATVTRQVVEHGGENDRLTVVRARAVPNGWTGKLWALSEGSRRLRHSRLITSCLQMRTSLTHGPGGAAL